MSIPSQERPFFCLAAFAGEYRYPSADLSAVAKTLDLARSKPMMVGQYELSAESILRNNGFDPADDRGWLEAGVAGGRAAAAETIKLAYQRSVSDFVDHLRENVKYNPYDFTASKPTSSILQAAVNNFKRAYQDESPDYLLSDEAWVLVGYETPESFQSTIRDIFINGKVGGYVAAELNPKGSDVSRVDELSIKAADAHIREAFPELANRLGIPEDIKGELLPKVSATAASFGQASGEHFSLT